MDRPADLRRGSDPDRIPRGESRPGRSARRGRSTGFVLPDSIGDAGRGPEESAARRQADHLHETAALHLPDAPRVPRLFLRLRGHRRRRGLRSGAARPVAGRPRSDRRPPAERQLHDARPLVRCQARSTSPLRSGPRPSRTITRRSGGAFTSTPWTPTGGTCGSSPRAATTTSIPARCRTAASRSCPRVAAASAAVTTRGSRCRPTRCTGMDAAGGNIRTLSFHETNEWHPAVLNDGRIVYIALGLRGPLGRQLSRPVGQPSGRHEPEHLVRQLHAADQRLLSSPRRSPAPTRSRSSPGRITPMSAARW